MQLVRLALPDKDNGKPTAAFAATAAGTGDRMRGSGIHGVRLVQMGKKEDVLDRVCHTRYLWITARERISFRENLLEKTDAFQQVPGVQAEL